MPKAVLSQYFVLFRLLLSGKINYDEAADIIEKYSRERPVNPEDDLPSPVIKTRQQHFEYWETYYPRRGARIMRILDAVIEKGIKARQEVDDLTGRARSAMYWRPNLTVNVIYSADMLEKAREEAGYEFKDELHDQFDTLLKANITPDVRDRLESAISVWLWRWFRGTLAYQPAKSRVFAANQVYTGLFYAIAFVLADMDNMALRLKPLLELQADGNFPMWVNRKNEVEFFVRR
ncbi:MAG: hypothetical protein ACOYUZ_00735 [Patescibacteria group bacterium]